MSRKVLAGHVQRGTSSALAALFGAWVQSVAARPDQRLGWQDAAIGLGLLLLAALRQRS